MPRTRKKTTIPAPPAYYPEAFDFYRERDTVSFIPANCSAETYRGSPRSGVVHLRPGGPKNIFARAVWIMDTSPDAVPKRGEPPRMWRLEHVRIYTVRRDQVLIAKAAFIRGDV